MKPKEKHIAKNFDKDSAATGGKRCASQIGREACTFECTLFSARRVVQRFRDFAGLQLLSGAESMLEIALVM